MNARARKRTHATHVARYHEHVGAPPYSGTVADTRSFIEKATLFMVGEAASAVDLTVEKRVDQVLRLTRLLREIRRQRRVAELLKENAQ